jgi:hypothetical protein
MFRPFTGSSSGLYKNKKVYYILYYCVPDGIPCGLQSCTLSLPVQAVYTSVRDMMCVITFNFPSFRRSLYKLCTTLYVIWCVLLHSIFHLSVAPCTSCVQLCTRYVVCYYIQFSIFLSLPVQAVYNSVNHTGSRLAHNNIKCNTLSCFYIGLMMTQ